MNPVVVHQASAFRDACDGLRAQGRRVGLVPTMGALHAGHLALLEQAKRLTEAVCVTIFVNPTQFGRNEDFARYPRDLESDLLKCEQAGASLVFAPNTSLELYPEGEQTRVRVGALSRPLCGRFRPGHFEGVATIVAKLFALAGPCTAVFGRKDFQQLKVIERLVADLFLPVRIVGHPTVREGDGLATSSRNRYLSVEARQRARSIPQALADAVAAFDRGERVAGRLYERVRQRLEQGELEQDYVTLANPETLEEVASGGQVPERTLLAVACRVESTRLIDNVVLGEDLAPIKQAY